MPKKKKEELPFDEPLDLYSEPEDELPAPMVDIVDGRDVYPLEMLKTCLLRDAPGNLYQLDETHRGLFMLRLYQRAP